MQVVKIGACSYCTLVLIDSTQKYKHSFIAVLYTIESGWGGSFPFPDFPTTGPKLGGHKWLWGRVWPKFLGIDVKCGV